MWKTENSGRTWFPISDEGIPIGSIGAIAVAPSESQHRLRRHRRARHPQPALLRHRHVQVHRRGQDLDATSVSKPRVRSDVSWLIPRTRIASMWPLSATSTMPIPSAESIARLDGGTTWKKVLFKTSDPDNVGAIDLAIDPKNPRVLYASLWATRRPPWAVYAPTNLPGGGLYKSTDGGDTWKQLAGGLPTGDFVGKIGIAVAPSNPNRLWAVVDDVGSAVPAGFRFTARTGAPPPPSSPEASTSPMTPAPPGNWSTPGIACGAAAGISKL